MYRCGLKEYIQVELKLYKPKTIEEARHAAKIIKQKLKFKMSSFKEDEDQNSSKKESNKCRYCGDKWASGHRSLKF